MSNFDNADFSHTRIGGGAKLYNTRKYQAKSLESIWVGGVTLDESALEDGLLWY